MVEIQTRLKVGMVIVLGGRHYLVEMVNESRARCVPVEKRLRDFVPQTGRNAGKQRRYFEPLPPVSISPNSEVAVK